MRSRLLPRTARHIRALRQAAEVVIGEEAAVAADLVAIARSIVDRPYNRALFGLKPRSRSRVDVSQAFWEHRGASFLVVAWQRWAAAAGSNESTLGQRKVPRPRRGDFGRTAPIGE